METKPMVLINFSHPMTEEHLMSIHQLTGINSVRVINAKVQVNFDYSITTQMIDVLRSIDLTATEWQTLPILINPAGFSPAAQILLVLLHGLMGHFPAATLLRPIPGTTPTQFEVYDILNLQDLRNKARAELR